MEPSPKQPQQLNIALGSSVTTLIGHTWPKSQTGYMDATAIEAPSVLTIVFPDKSKVQVISIVTFLRQKNDKVCAINIAPLSREANYQAAISMIRSLNHKLNFSNKVDVETQLESWQSRVDNNDPFSSKSFRGTINGGVSVFVELRAGNEPDKWIVSYEFTLDKVYRPPTTSQ